MKTKGKAFTYGDNVDTDVIIPARYLNTPDARELAKHAMEDIDASFVSRVSSGDVIVAGANFGCGSSREHAPLVLKECGVGCVVAKSFARIFYRNAINIGLPIMECDCLDGFSEGDQIEIDFDSGEIKNLTKDTSYKSQPFPPFIQEIINAGGLLASIKKGK